MTGQVGPRGLAILVLAGITGILLAILGWSQRGTGLVAPSVGGPGGAARTSAGVAGQPLPPARFYAGGGKVYILESNLGHDSGDLDYNLSDDGLIVTNVQGRIVA
jgi:hypothetical protein